MSQPEIAGYTLREVLGRSPSIETWRALDSGGSEVVVKLFRTNSAESIVTFVSRALSCSRMRSAHFAALRERGKSGDVLFSVRSYFRGGTLEAHLPSLGASQRLAIALRLGRGLEHAHLHGLVHGAIKPANVLFETIDTPVLVDPALLNTAVSGELTPPEQAFSVAHDPRVDQFALAGLTRWLLSTAPERFSDAGLEAAIERARSTDAERRFRTLAELVSEIEGAVGRSTQASSPDTSTVELKLSEQTLRVSVSGTWTPRAVETCSRDIARALQERGAQTIGYVLHAQGGCHSTAIDALADLHRRYRSRLRRVAFVSDSPQARGASVLIGTRVAGLDWKTFATVDSMEAWLREASK